MKGILGFIWPVVILILLIVFRYWYNQQSNPIGKKLYGLHCSNCHMDKGQGLAKLIPPLANVDFLKNYRDSIPCYIRNGMQGEIKVNGIIYNQPMPANKALSSSEIYHIIDYINHTWGNDIPSLPSDSIDTILDQCP